MLKNTGHPVFHAAHYQVHILWLVLVLVYRSWHVKEEIDQAVELFVVYVLHLLIAYAFKEILLRLLIKTLSKSLIIDSFEYSHIQLLMIHSISICLFLHLDKFILQFLLKNIKSKNSKFLLSHSFNNIDHVFELLVFISFISYHFHINFINFVSLSFFVDVTDCWFVGCEVTIFDKHVYLVLSDAFSLVLIWGFAGSGEVFLVSLVINSILECFLDGVIRALA